uniref:Uncharacterized protein n=1 Tax=Cyanistes caeruleus TaxID=156563 RepID=A0A8C0V7S8_CYACU
MPASPPLGASSVTVTSGPGTATPPGGFSFSPVTMISAVKQKSAFAPVLRPQGSPPPACASALQGQTVPKATKATVVSDTQPLVAHAPWRVPGVTTLPYMGMVGPALCHTLVPRPRCPQCPQGPQGP